MKGGGNCARGSVVGGGNHVSSGGGSTPPNAAVGARWRSMHVRFVTSETELLNSLTLLLIKHFFHVNLVKYHCQYNMLKHRHFRKFDFMLKQRSQQFSPHVTYNPNWIINLSNVEIPDVVLKNLSLGNKYNFPYIGNSEFLRSF